MGKQKCAGVGEVDANGSSTGKMHYIDDSYVDDTPSTGSDSASFFEKALNYFSGSGFVSNKEAYETKLK